MMVTLTLHENTGRMPFDINCRNFILDQFLIMKNKTQVHRRDLMDSKSICTEGKTETKAKDNPQNGKEMFAEEDAHNKFISRTDKQLNACSSLSKPITINRKTGKSSKWIFLQRRHTCGHKAHLKKKKRKETSASLIIREMQIKTARRY